MNIYSIFEKTASEHANTIAIIEGKSALSFVQLTHEINAEARRFSEKGIRSGDRVLVFVPMGIGLYRTVLALFKIGATAVFLDEWVSLDRLKLCCSLAACKALIGGWKLRSAAVFFKETRNIPIHISPKKIRKSSDLPTKNVENDHPALITFTTGSTGTPKAALRSHGFLKAQLEALNLEIEPKPGEICMTTLPIVLLIQLAAGSTSVIPDFNQRKPEKMQPEAIFDQINNHQVQRLIASPFFVEQLAKYSSKTGRTCSLSDIITGGAPVFPDAAELFRTAFPNSKIRIAFGSTEAEPISMATVEEIRENEKKCSNYGLFVGRLHPWATVKIMSISDMPMSAESGALKEMPFGEIGEIIVSGAHVLKTYFNNQTAWERNKIPDGERIWHRTGDAGRFDKHGNLYLVGRCASFLDGAVGSSSPFLVEFALKNIEEIKEGTLIFQKKNPIFCIVPSSDSSASEIEQTLQHRFDFPFSVRFFKALPKDPRHHSKIDYGKLTSMLISI